MLNLNKKLFNKQIVDYLYVLKDKKILTKRNNISLKTYKIIIKR